MSNKIIDIYDDYIKGSRQPKDPKYEGWFRASSAGYCHKKQLYSLNEDKYPPKTFDTRVARLLRLGTVVHKDIEKAVKIYCLDHPDEKILTEKVIEIPELKVVGHYDIAVINESDGKISVDIVDAKTCASYKWRMKFGRNKDKNPSFNYELQVGTYGLGITSKYDADSITLNLLWYNKDTSAMRSVEIDAFEWTSKAMEYWANLNEALDETKDLSIDERLNELMPGVSYGVPMMNWECRYCQFIDYCGGT